MSQYNNHWRFPPPGACSGFANTRNVGPATFGPNYGPGQGQGHNGPSFYPRHGPPRWANAYPMWRSHNNNMQPTAPTRPKGPRTPPDPPPEDQPSIESYTTPSKEKPYRRTNDYNDYHSNDEIYHNQHWAPQRQFHKNQNRNMRGRRNSQPLPMPNHQTTPFPNTCHKNMDYDACNPPLSDTEKEPPSALNTAVQSYLLQVLTAQPPPNIFPTSYNRLPPTASLPYHTHSTQSPPPLPPTPIRPATPPPPPSDEENWDTPSEASNDGTTFKLNSPNQENVPNIENNVANALASAQTCDTAIDIGNRIDTWEMIPQMTAPSDNTGRRHDDSVAQMDYNSFKIIIPSRVDRVAHEVGSVEGNVMKEDALSKNRGNLLESALNIDIPNPPSDEENWDTPSEASNDGTTFKLNSPNQENVSNIDENVADTLASAQTCDTAIDIGNRIDTWEMIPQMTAPSDNTGRRHDDSVAQMDYNSFKIIIPSRVDRVAHEVGSVEGNVTKDDALNENHGNSLESALTINIPNPDVITGSITNQEENSLDKLESVLKIVTPKKTSNLTEGDNVSYRITLPHREDSQSQERESVKGSTDKTLTKTKSKRRNKSGKSTSKVWPLELAEKALCVEQELLKEVSKDNILILRFPDPTLSREIVKDFCEDIESVHFQQNSAPRYCFVHLKEGVDVVKSIEILSKIPFGNGLIKAELKNAPVGKPCSAKADNIDPFTLYVGNLSPTVPCKVLKEHFPGASRINIGFAQRMKYTRYAFIQYQKVDDAIAAYRRMFKSEIEGRSLIIRFKRLASAATMDEESQMHRGFINDYEEHVDACSMISTSTMPSDMTEDTVITTAESDRSECVASIDNNRDLNTSGDNCDETNVQQQLDQDSEINPSSNKQTTLAAVSDVGGGLNAISIDVVNVNEISESFCRSEELVSSNGNKGLNHDDFNVPKHPIEDPQECVMQTSTTQTETESTAMEEIENSANIESTKHSNSNAVQTLTSESEEGYVDDTVTCRSTNTVKSEELLCGIEANEKIVYSMPRPSQRLENRNSGVDVKNKCELNEEFEFFSVRRTSVSALEVETERPSSTNSYCSSIEFANACFSDQYLETIEMAKAVQRRKKGREPKETVSHELLENINRDMNLLSQALQNNIHCSGIKHDLNANDEILLIDDDISVTPSTGQFQTNKFDDNTGSDEDLVPSTALLLRRDNRLVSVDAASTHSYHINSPQQVKNEFVECGTPESAGAQTTKNKLKETKFIPEITKDPTQATNARNNGSRKRKSPSSVEDLKDMKPVVPNDDDDDDLVPANCALHLFKKSIQFFDLTLDEEDPLMQLKREAETEDLFSLPKRTDKGKRARTESRSSDCTNDDNLSRSFRALENNKQQSNGIKSINEAKAPSCTDDDDVVIITDDISPQPHQNLPLTQCLSYANQNDALRIKHEHNLPTSIENSFFDKHKRPSQHRDNLDRLFALLNSNSDEDL